MGQVPGIGALHAHHTGVLTELPGKLAVAYIHRVDLAGSILQHTVRKAAGGGTDVSADAAIQLNGKFRHGFFQLQTAPAYILQSIPTNFDFCVIGDRCSGLVHPLTVDEHQTAHNGGLCLLAAFLKPLLRQQHIQPRFIAHRTWPPLPFLPHRQRQGRTDAAVDPPGRRSQTAPDEAWSAVPQSWRGTGP